MDKRIRRNELCVIGLPRCDFVFSSTRSCFIGYGFQESALEMSILRNVLKERGVLAVEAGGSLAPGQSAFCAKICSKIITSQFCAILLNNDIKDGREIPNANVNMEYGLMLGFNKYVIPFQREAQRLPFNVAGLDTVKYENQNFEQKARDAVDVAIAATTQELSPSFSPDQILEAFLLSQRLLFVPLNNEGDRTLFELGRPLGLNMLMTFDGMKYVYFGNYTTLRSEVIIWRIRTLEAIISERFGSIDERVRLGLAQLTPALKTIMDTFLAKLEVWVLTTSAADRSKIVAAFSEKPCKWPVRVYELSEIQTALDNVR
jgi:hypothetical protein